MSEYNEWDYWKNDYIICPYCNHEFIDSWEYNDLGERSTEINCEKCDKVMFLEIEMSVVYTTKKITQNDDNV